MTAGPPTTPLPLVGSPILAMSRRAAGSQARGHDIVDLTRGGPDFAPPSHVADAAIEAIRHAAARDRGLACLSRITETAVLEQRCRRIVAGLGGWR